MLCLCVLLLLSKSLSRDTSFGVSPLFSRLMISSRTCKYLVYAPMADKKKYHSSLPLYAVLHLFLEGVDLCVPASAGASISPLTLLDHMSPQIRCSCSKARRALPPHRFQGSTASFSHAYDTLDTLLLLCKKENQNRKQGRWKKVDERRLACT